MKKTSLSLAIGLSVVAQQSGAAGFIEDTKVNAGLRNFYYNADNHEGGADEKDWAQAFRLDVLSGFTEGTVGFGLDVTGNLGIKLDGGRGNHPDGSSFIPSDSNGSGKDSWSTAGATAKMKFSKTEFRVGNSLQPMLPVIMTNDSRVLSQLYQGGMVTSKEIDGVTLTAGQIEHTVTRASSNWTELSVAGGTEGSNQFRFAGGDWQVNKDLKLQYYFANLEDYYKQHFAGLVHVLPIGDNQSFKTDLRYFNSSSDGKNKSAAGRAEGYSFNNNSGYSDGGEVDNRTWSAMFTYSLGGHSLMLGYQSVSDSGSLPWLNQGSVVKDGNGRGEGQGGSDFYLFTNAMIGSFVRAGEKSKFGQYSYDFAKAGVPGLKASIAYIKGDEIRDYTANTPSGEWERDERIDYTFQEGSAKGLTLTLRHGYYKGGAALADTDQYRVIVSYPLSIL